MRDQGRLGACREDPKTRGLQNSECKGERQCAFARDLWQPSIRKQEILDDQPLGHLLGW